MIVTSFSKYSLVILIFGCIYILINKMTQKKTYSEKPQGRSLSMFFAAICAALPLGYYLQLLVSSILQIIKFTNPKLLESYFTYIRNSYSPSNGILALITTIILAPIGEELMFRGVFLKCCTNYLHLNKIFSVCLTGIVFGLLHGNAVQICYAIPLGILLGYLAVSFRSILPGIFLHVSVNTSAYLLPTFFFQIKKATIIMAVASAISVLILCYVLISIVSRYTKYLDK